MPRALACCSLLLLFPLAARADSTQNFAAVEVHNIQPVPLVTGEETTTKTISQGWTRIPKWAEGWQVYAKGEKTIGVLDFTAKSAGIVYIACNWDYQGNNSGNWTKERWTLDQFKSDGWEPVAGELVSNRNRSFAILRKSVKPNQTFRLRCNKYEPPYILVPTVNENLAAKPAADNTTPDLASAEIVPIDARSEQGYVVGKVKKGSTILLQYVKGKWKSWGGIATESPDAEKTERGDLCRLAIADNSAKGKPSIVLQVVPAGTAQTPFAWTADRDVDVLILRMNSSPKDWSKNPDGGVEYRFKVLPPGATIPRVPIATTPTTPTTPAKPVPTPAPIARTAPPSTRTPTSFDFPVTCEKPDPAFKPSPVTDPDQIERPDYQSHPKSLQKSLATATAMMVTISEDGDTMGLTSDIIATVNPDSRRSEKAGVGIIRSDGDPTMGTALEEALRAVRLRYPTWEPGHIDLSFGEKSIKHGGPSAGTAFALLMLSCLEGFELDPRCAVTGDITVDWKVRKVGGVTAKIRGATLDKCLYAAIPEHNETAFADMALLYGTKALFDIQVFSIATLQDANNIARKDRPEKLQQAIKLFADLQPELTRSEKTTLQKPETKQTLQKILDLAPNHLSAKYLLAIADGKASKTLSANATMYRLDIILYPYMKALYASKKLDRTTLPVTVTANARKQLAQLRPIAHKDFQQLFIDETAFIESMDQFATSASSYTLETLKTRAANLVARFDELATNKDLRATLRTEGY